MIKTAHAIVRASLEVKETFAQSGLEKVVRAAEIIAQAFTAEHKLLIFGNGGSAADAQHLAAEYVNRFKLERPPLPAIALTTDTSILTAVGNDYSFDEVFVKQIKALGQAGDVALGISTSGRSSNVLAGLSAARAKGLTTLGLTGQGPSEMESLCDLLIQAPSASTPRIQEVHGLAIHILCELTDLILFGRSQ